MKSIAVAVGIAFGVAGGVLATWQPQSVTPHAVVDPTPVAQVAAIAPQQFLPPASPPPPDIKRFPGNASTVRSIWFQSPNRSPKLVLLPITQAQSDLCPGHPSDAWVMTPSGLANQAFWNTTDEGYDAVP